MDIVGLAKGMGLSLAIGVLMGMCSYFWGQQRAGVRVYTLICVGCMLATYISVNLGSPQGESWLGDPARIAAQLVSAVGFIVAGMIWYHDSRVQGLSSAALLWVTAILGIMSGAGLFREIIISLVVIGILILLFDYRSLRKR